MSRTTLKGYQRKEVTVPKVKKQKFQKRLLHWYEKSGRDLPWRRTSDPYKILVSEIMLQQTQVDRVIPKFHEFLAKYPTIQALSQASPEEVRKTWYPLGYNIRPYRLREIACESVERYGGTIPRLEAELLSMKGIGRYTAGAIRSFAFNQDAPILDTNVMRVLFRVFIGEGDPKKLKNQLWILSEKLIPRGRGYDFNQALMDFGAMVCTARKPTCLICPMREICQMYSS
ncbi:MAG: A/G-specific adenine glycosylase [Nitrospira sp.]|nr:A/G-specific adenine glycosylase [Nitrospira sp.]MCB9711200.1 A/G-specific adenine glycosylase [Nitrospiraceae bacterium]